MRDKEIVLNVTGMTCNNCATGISRSLQKEGFKDADANFIDGEVSFTIQNSLKIDDAVRQIEILGYKVSDENVSAAPINSLEQKLIFSALFTIPLFSHMFFDQSAVINIPLVQLGLSLPVFIIGFLHFGKSALGSLKARTANMDVLIFIGTTAAFAYSLVGTYIYAGTELVHNYLFYETSATIITLVLLGNVIESRAVKQTKKQIGELQSLENPKAKIVIKVGRSEKIFETDASVVKPGDILQINEGDGIPVDGKMVSEEAFLDESAITGESMPILKKTGDMIFSGSIAVEGNFQFQASSIANNSTLQKILKLVKAARKDQPKIQILGDRISAIFVPAVLIISALTFLIAHFVFDVSTSQALMNSVAVLVISCPCAMGLATPTAVVAGIGRAAKHGVIIKGGSTLEDFANTNTLVLDKTGTITDGSFEIQSIGTPVDPKHQRIIKSLESHSSHPIAKAFIQNFEKIDPVELFNVSEVKSQGMFAKLKDGSAVYFGKSSIADCDLEFTINGLVHAKFKIQDQIRKSSNKVIEKFKKNGFRVIILSGDTEKKVKTVAHELGIDEFHFGMSPEEKLRIIKDLSQDSKVAMVGDGINDGPSLAASHVGISHGGASTLAIESSKIVLMNEDTMMALYNSYEISKLSYATIKQNLFWAFAYNIIAIPIAAFGFLNPMIAALSMAFSDVIVIGNSIRLRFRNI